MTNRERMLAILNHQPPDRIPWIPRLMLWYNARIATNTMPPQWEKLSLRELEQALGLGLGSSARYAKIYDIRYDDVDIVTREEGGRRITEYHTPVGMVQRVMESSEELKAQGIAGTDIEFPLKGPDDYRVWEWVVEHTHWVPAYDKYETYDADIGDDGLPMTQIGADPFYEFVLLLAGYMSAYYQLADYTREVEHLIAVMTEAQRERLWPVILDSPAPFILYGGQYSSQFTPPPIFKKYILPYFQELIPLLHERGKFVAMHADNDVSLIMDLVEQAGWDMVECFVTAPMGPLTLEHAREVWGNRMIIWGALPSVVLSPSVPEEEFRAYVHKIFDIIAPGDAFILGVSDNVMPDSLIERIIWVSEVVEQRGYYPVRARTSA